MSAYVVRGMEARSDFAEREAPNSGSGAMSRCRIP